MLRILGEHFPPSFHSIPSSFHIYAQKSHGKKSSSGSICDWEGALYFPSLFPVFMSARELFRPISAGSLALVYGVILILFSFFAPYKE